MNTDRELINTREASSLAGVHPRTLHRWRRAGALTIERDPETGRVWYRRSEVVRLSTEEAQVIRMSRKRTAV